MFNSSTSPSAPKKHEFKLHYDSDKKTVNNVPLWKLFIDKSWHHYNDPFFFDTHAGPGELNPQPGYHAAMVHAFESMFKTLGRKLDANEFKEIHHQCVNNVKGVGSNEKDFNLGSYGICYKKITEDAKKEWESEHLIARSSQWGNPLFWNAIMSRGAIGSCVYSTLEAKDAKDQHKISQKVNSIMDEYYKALDQAQADDAKKLLAIVSVCRKLEIGHFFVDGNQRSIVFCILNKLLIENGFPPTILDDPLIFDGYLAARELVREVQKGQQYFLQVGEEHRLAAANQTKNNAAHTTPKPP